jgi:hypothetical protein
MTSQLFRTNWLVGQTQAIWGDEAAPGVLEGWAEMYGGVYKRPGPIGIWDAFFTDPKAVATLFSRTDVRSILSLRLEQPADVMILGRVPPTCPMESHLGKHGMSFG